MLKELSANCNCRRVIAVLLVVDTVCLMAAHE